MSGFNFGSKPATSTLGGFNFGSSASTTTTSSTGGFGFGSFGAKTTGTATASTFSFGKPGGLGATTTTQSSFSFGSGFSSGFGSTAKTTASLFGGFGTTTTTSASTGFGSGFGSTFGTGTGSSFGTGLSTGLSTGLNTQQQQQQNQLQQQGIDPHLFNLASALVVPTIYGDERDVLICKWNQLQAFWGTGKGFISQNNSVTFNPENPFCRFKTVGYCMKFTSKDEKGLVILILNKKEEEVRSQQQQFVESLQRILGNKPTLSVCVEGLKAISSDKCEVTIYILERSPTGVSKRIPAKMVYQVLSQSNMQTQLKSLSVVGMVPRIAWSEEQLQQYLNNPPFGYDARLWRQARLDNPDPDNLIPVPMVGFEYIKNRLEEQALQTKQHHQTLENISKDIQGLQQQQNSLLARLAKHRQKHQDLSHRLLQVIVKQEVQRKRGLAIQLEEEQLRTVLEALHAELNAPTQLKGRLNEMLSHIRLQGQGSFGRPEDRFELSHEMQQEVKLHLKQQQKGISHLVNVIKEDLEDLKLIEQDLTEIVTARR